MSVKFDESRLTRWRRLLVLRDVAVIDGQRRSWCPMCAHAMPIWRLQAHHLYPKYLYPEKAYDLDNGIMLCLRCHMSLVHGGNSFKDVELKRWRFFLPALKRYVGLAKQRQYNEANQGRVRRGKRS